MQNTPNLDPGDAVRSLLESIPEGPAWNNGDPENNWVAAATAVHAADEQTVRAALQRLLALELFRRQSKYPQVTSRNVKVNDHLLLGGVPHVVTSKIDRGNQCQTVYIEASLAHLKDPRPDTFINAWDVGIPLVARPPVV